MKIMQNMHFFAFFLLQIFSSFSFSVLHLMNQNAMKFKVQFSILADLFSPKIWSSSGWQKLAAFQRGQKWPQIFRQARNCYFYDKFVVFVRNCKLQI